MSNPPEELSHADALPRLLSAANGKPLRLRNPVNWGGRPVELLMAARDRVELAELAHGASGLDRALLDKWVAEEVASVVMLQPAEVQSVQGFSVVLRCAHWHPWLPNRLVTIDVRGTALYAEVERWDEVDDAAALQALEAIRNRREATVLDPIVARLGALPAGDRVRDLLWDWKALYQLVFDGDLGLLRTVASRLCSSEADRRMLQVLPDAALRVCLSVGLQDLAYEDGVLWGGLTADPRVGVTVEGDEVRVVDA